MHESNVGRLETKLRDLYKNFYIFFLFVDVSSNARRYYNIQNTILSKLISSLIILIALFLSEDPQTLWRGQTEKVINYI